MADALDNTLDSVRGVTMPELLRRAVRAELAELALGCLPARVERYDASKQLVDVSILIRDFYRDEEGALQTWQPPVITNLPIVLPAGGGYVLMVPIAVGDTGCLMAGARSFDRWLSGNGDAVDPELYYRNAITDGCFVPGLFPFGAPRQSAPTDHAIIGKDGGVQIHMRSSTITIGDESGSKFIGRDGDTVDCGTLYFTPNAGMAPAVLTYVGPPGPYPPPVPPVTAIPLSGKLSASATQAKAK